MKGNDAGSADANGGANKHDGDPFTGGGGAKRPNNSDSAPDSAFGNMMAAKPGASVTPHKKYQADCPASRTNFGVNADTVC